MTEQLRSGTAQAAFRPALDARRRRVASRAALLVALLVALNVVFLVLLTLSQAVSSNELVGQLRTGAREGLISSNNYPVTSGGHMVDAFTECVALGMNTYSGGGSPLRRAIASSQRGSCGYLVPALFGQRPIADVTYDLPPQPYYRFWHGYQVLTRPILALAGVRGIRDGGEVMLLAALLFLGVTVARGAGVLAALALVAPLVALTDFGELQLSFPHALDVAAALALAPAVWHALRQSRGDPWWLATAALCAGAIYNFLNFLLNPALALTLVAFLPLVWTACTGGQRWHRAGIGRAAVATGAWLVGYVGTFLGKWIAAAMIFGTSAVASNIKNDIGNRIGGLGYDPSVHEGPHGDLSFGAATLDNLRVYGTGTILLILVIAALLFAHSVYRRGGRTLADFLVLAAPAAIPFVWYELIREHSVRHYWFTYRSLAISFGILLASAITVGRGVHEAHGKPGELAHE